MMERTDRHCRYFLRLVSRHTLLYTEMITTAALQHGDRDRLLAFDESEHPLALQLGGSDPAAMAACARMAEERDFDEVNMNVGCPSPRVRSGRFGACLMTEPDRVADCVAAMGEATRLPVTVKTRIGVDEQDSYECLADFVTRVAEAGCGTFIIHARKAWLSGLSPKQNRCVPPLRYDVVERLKSDFPSLCIVLNGGIADLGEVQTHLAYLDGVMIGREAYHNPYMLARADAVVFGDQHPIPDRAALMEQLAPYVERELRAGTRFVHMGRHLMGLYQGVPGARAWRRALSTACQSDDASARALLDAIPATNVDDAAAA
jgi:tRNA-dihydrouridine synthase A